MERELNKIYFKGYLELPNGTYLNFETNDLELNKYKLQEWLMLEGITFN